LQKITVFFSGVARDVSKSPRPASADQVLASPTARPTIINSEWSRLRERDELAGHSPDHFVCVRIGESFRPLLS